MQYQNQMLAQKLNGSLAENKKLEVQFQNLQNLSVTLKEHLATLNTENSKLKKQEKGDDPIKTQVRDTLKEVTERIGELREELTGLRSKNQESDL